MGVFYYENMSGFLNKNHLLFLLILICCILYLLLNGFSIFLYINTTLLLFSGKSPSIFQCASQIQFFVSICSNLRENLALYPRNQRVCHIICVKIYNVKNKTEENSRLFIQDFRAQLFQPKM